MRIEIRQSGDQNKCETCGATPLIHTQRGLKLESEIVEPPRRKFLKRAAHKHLVAQLDALRRETLRA